MNTEAVKPSTSLGDMLRRRAAASSGEIAMLVPGKEGFASLTYKDVWALALGYAGVFLRMGVGRGDRVAIYSENGYEWALADWACQVLGAILVPIYPTLPADQAEYIVRDSGAILILAGSNEHLRSLDPIADVAKALLRGHPDSVHERAADPEARISQAEAEAAISPIGLDETATIIYTSGTTGTPKGVMLTHRNFLHVSAALMEKIPFDFHMRTLAFLPQAHIFERIGQVLLFYAGGTIGYAKSLASLSGDLMAVRPTLLLCVPRFLENLRDRVLAGVAKQPPLRQKLFQAAIAQGVARRTGKFAPLAGVLDSLVGKKVRALTGGEVRYMVSGGAALAPHVAEFYLGLGFTILQGYGLTETTGGSFVNHPDRNKYWTVGEDLNIEASIAPDGEILLRGPGVMKGYYNLPQETAEAMDADGWFHTGDIGEFEGKNLKITDRKKDLIVLANGKNVAPQPIENRLKESRYIAEAVVFGDGLDHLVGLIIPNFDSLRATITELGMKPPETDAELVALPEVRRIIQEEVAAANKTRANFEYVKKHTVLATPFSVEAGDLTPSLKVRKKVVQQKYAAELASMS